jgi:hypothetical protein
VYWQVVRSDYHRVAIHRVIIDLPCGSRYIKIVVQYRGTKHYPWRFVYCRLENADPYRGRSFSQVDIVLSSLGYNNRQMTIDIASYIFVNLSIIVSYDVGTSSYISHWDPCSLILYF